MTANNDWFHPMDQAEYEKRFLLERLPQIEKIGQEFLERELKKRQAVTPGTIITQHVFTKGESK